MASENVEVQLPGLDWTPASVVQEPEPLPPVPITEVDKSKPAVVKEVVEEKKEVKEEEPESKLEEVPYKEEPLTDEEIVYNNAYGWKAAAKGLSGISLLLFIGCVICAVLSTIGTIPTWNDSTSFPGKTLAIPVDALLWALSAGFLALFIVGFYSVKVLNTETGTNEMITIAYRIAIGAKSFLYTEYKYLFVFVFCLFWVLVGVIGGLSSTGGIAKGFSTAACFLIGAIFSGACGFFGMTIAVRSNIRTTAAARQEEGGLNKALKVAFNAGSVMGLSVIGMGIIGLSVLYLIFADVQILAGFAFGASSIALFARVAGGIYTKAADVGADMVGKVEAGIPEDDPRNPGVIADNVGDNVGDVAGMGADLFESYVGSIVAAATLGGDRYGTAGVALPFWVASLGVVCSVVGTFMVWTKEKATQNELLFSLRRAIFFAAFLVLGASPAITWLLNFNWQYWVIIIIGLVSGIGIGTATEYFTSFAYKPTQSIAESGTTGAATVVIKGLAVGMHSTIPPAVILIIAMVASIFIADYHCANEGKTLFGAFTCDKDAGTYGVSIAAVAMLSTLGVTLATDAYGPVADNAGGIAEMAEHSCPDTVREKTDALDSLGNTTAATGKGFAIGSAVLTALALMSTYTDAIERETGQVFKVLAFDDQMFLPGVIIGALLPFVFSALTMNSVALAAESIIEEVRRQFREIPGLREGKPGVRPDYTSCVEISTKAALKFMLLPGFMAVLVPIVTGVALGAIALAGLLIGGIVSGFLLGVTMANAGGSWDNAKKYVESGGLKKDGVVQGKGTTVHKATVVGDTVGDPFKDTSGPSLNILIKLMSIVSLVMTPIFRYDVTHGW